MAEKRLNTRIIHKHETEANWLLSSLVPMKGELIVYDIDENYNYERVKIGDGKTNVNALPFVGDNLADFGRVNTTITSDEEFDAAIDSCIAQMSNDSVRNASINWHGLHSVTLHKHLDNYVDVEDITYQFTDNLKTSYYKRTKSMVEGEWNEWEYVNPPMLSNIEYRTTDRYNGKAVYKRLTSDGELQYRLYGDSKWSSYSEIIGANDYTDTQITNMVGDTAVSEQINAALVNNQADWNQNDDTKADYIKNRPFYSENPVEESVLTNTSFDFNGDDAYFGDFSISIETELLQEIEPGVEYIVTFNGTEYRRTAFVDGYRVVIGNAAFVAGSDTGEPFLIATHGGTLADICVDNSNQSVHTISITAIKVNVHKIDMKYIPDCLMPKTTYVELEEYEWIDDGSLLYQVVEIGGVTANSKVDLQPTAYQILDLQNNDIAFVLENNDGVVTAYCLGGTPNKSYTMQVLITEVLPI